MSCGPRFMTCGRRALPLFILVCVAVAIPTPAAWARRDGMPPPHAFSKEKKTQIVGTPTATPAPEPPRLGKLRLRGNDSISRRKLVAEMNTQPRPWYRFWAKRPKFVVEDLRSDVERLERYYEANGRYQTKVRYAIVRRADNTRVDVDIDIAEAEAIPVGQLRLVDEANEPISLPEDLVAALPLRVGEAFNEAAYRDTEVLLREGLRDRGHARARVTREATIDVGGRSADVVYHIAAGPECVYGTVEIEGTKNVAPYIVERELDLEAGQPFRPQQLIDARDRLLELGLFSSVQILAADSELDNPVVDLLVRVEERPFRDIRVGVGYGSEDEFRAQFRWANRNWLGGGRRLSFDAKYSSIETSGIATLVQPHLFSPHLRGIVEAGHDQLDEDTFLLNETRIRPRVEWRLSSKLVLWGGYRLARIQLNNFDAETADALGGIRRRGYISGPIVGLVRTSLDDALDPHRGGVVSLIAEQSGLWWSGDFDYYKLSAEMKRFYPIPGAVTFGMRAKIAVVDDLDSHLDVPLHERLFVGGDRSVRGYGRHRLGPRSSTDEPLGGQSAIEGSLELRRRIWEALGGAVFFDFGEVSTQPYRYLRDRFELAAGFGITYATPVGPLRLDLGIPFDPPGDDQAWQIHFSVGQFF